MLLIFRNTVADGEVVDLDSSKKDANSNSDNKDSVIEVLLLICTLLYQNNVIIVFLTCRKKLGQVIRLGMQNANAGLLYNHLVSLVLLLVDGILCQLIISPLYSNFHQLNVKVLWFLWFYFYMCRS